MLVNNAYHGGNGTIKTSTDSDFSGAFEVAVTAVNRLIKVLLPNLIKGFEQSGNSSVVNIASMYGLVSPKLRIYTKDSNTNPPFYGAAKAALIQYTRYAACEFAEFSVRVNSISPGAFPNLEVKNNDEFFISRLIENVPLRRIGKPTELANVVLFLSSSASSYITGENIVVDGGWTIK